MVINDFVQMLGLCDSEYKIVCGIVGFLVGEFCYPLLNFWAGFDVLKALHSTSSGFSFFSNSIMLIFSIVDL